MFIKTKVLITGAGGFIGSNLLDYIQKLDSFEVLGIDNNPRIKNPNLTILDIKDINTLSFSPDIIFHLAAQSRVQPSFTHPTKSVKDNVMGTLSVLEYAKKHGSKVIYAGSSSKHFNHYLSPYSTTKYMGENLCNMFKECFGLNVEIARFYNVYGPNEALDPVEGNVIGIWRYNIENNKVCQIVGDGKQQRDFIHVSDIVSGLMSIALTNISHGDAWELGTGSTTSINELANMFIKKFDNKFTYIPNQKGNMKKTLLVNNDTYDKLGWLPKGNLLDYIMSL
jgi:UDP-glucose 4-epimerase